MARSKTYEMLLKIAGRTDSSLKAACSAAEKDLATLGDAAKAAGSAAATALAGIVTTAAGIAASSLSAYSEFEQAMDSTAITARATEDEYALMEAAAREMEATTTKTATEAAEAMGATPELGEQFSILIKDFIMGYMNIAQTQGLTNGNPDE